MKTFTRKIALLVFAAASAGCAGAGFNGQEHALTPAEQHPISVDSQTMTMTIGLTDASAGLTSLDRARLRSFANAYLAGGHGALTITTPAGAGVASQDVSASVREALHEEGVPQSAMSASSYQRGDSTGSDVIVSFTKYVATPSACGIWEGMRERDYRNMRSPNFGCATQNNLAAMIGDPHDLVAPADMSDPDSEFRIRGVKAFREGSNSSSERDSDIEQKVSK